tara:strand:- start:1478 stop:1588 length:111 start_codon:yes stop_codon:yes gene_type:complete
MNTTHLLHKVKKEKVYSLKNDFFLKNVKKIIKDDSL